jgi:hypothetical protein
MQARILNFILFQAGWFACVWGGAHDLTPVAVAAAGVVVGVSLWPLGADWLRDLKLLLVVALIGWGVDSVHLYFGVFALIGTPRFPYLCPLWLVALWAAFGTTLRGSLSWLAGRYGLAALLGAVSGPLSYLAGAKLGAVTLHPNRIFSLVALAGGWAMVMPVLVWLAHGRPRAGGAK